MTPRTSQLTASPTVTPFFLGPEPGEPSIPASWRLASRFALFSFALLVCGAAVLPSQPSWVYVFGRWPVTEFVLGAIPFALLALPHWRSRILRARSWTLALGLAGLAAGIWAAPRAPLAFRTFGHLALFAITGFLCARLVASDGSLWRPLALCVTAVAGLVAFGGLLEVAAGSNPLYEGSNQNPYYAMYRAERRALSTQFNPAPLGSFLVMAWPFAAWLAGGSELRSRFLGRASLFFILSATFFTYSRGAFLGLAVSGALALLLARRRRALLAFASALVIVVSIASLLPYPFSKYGRQGFLASGGITSIHRLSRLEMTAAILADHPVLGIGFNGFRKEFDRYYPPHRPTWGKGSGAIDNAYLTLLAETGLLGAAALAAFLLIELRRGARAWRRSHSGFAGAALVSATGILVTAAGYDLLHWSGPAMFLVLALGLVSGSADAVDSLDLIGSAVAGRTTAGRSR